LSFASYHQVLFHHVILTSLCSEVNIYLFLYSKEVFHILKKQKERKRQVQNKKRAAQKNQKCGCPILPSLRTYPILLRLKLVRSGLSVLSDFIKLVNLSDFTRAENWSFLPDFTKAANLSVFTRAENWSDLACPFCPI
jgi:hypothetical protein